MDTSRIALDANLMLAVDARRFLCAMQEMTGGRIWATEQVWREVLDPDETAYAKCGHSGRTNDDVGRQCLEWALGACRPDDAANMPVDRLNGIVRRFAANIQRAGFIAVGNHITETLDDMSPDEREFSLRHAGGIAEHTRASEDRRLTAVGEQLSATGLSGTAAVPPAPGSNTASSCSRPCPIPDPAHRSEAAGDP